MTRAAAATAIAVLLGAGATMLLLRGGDDAPAPRPMVTPEATACEKLGERDRNPDDHAVAPAHGERLIGPGPDGGPPIGFNDDAALAGQVSLPVDLALHERAGSELLRVPLGWRLAEPAPGRIELGPYDRLYCAAVARGIRPVFVIMSGPDWAADLDRYCPAEVCQRPPTAAHLDELSEFAEQVAIRYPEAAAIEAWNEPNLAVFWADPDPGAYAEALAAIYEGVKNGDPGMPVLGGSLSNTTRTEPSAGKIGGVEFADALLAAGGAEHMDAFAFHPYPIEPLGRPGERFIETMEALRRRLRRHGADRMRIWITEVGLPTRPPPGEAGTPGKPAIRPSQQADTLVEIHRRLARSEDVEAILFHTLLDPQGAAPDAPRFGWVEFDSEGKLRPRPVYREFARG